MNNFIQNNGGPIAVGTIALLIGAAYLEWRIDIALDASLADVGLVSPDKIEAMEGDIEGNTDYIVRVESKAERIAQILMED